jgi:membrane-associated protease RseP (regulator of RpoE activity)
MPVEMHERPPSESVSENRVPPRHSFDTSASPAGGRLKSWFITFGSMGLSIAYYAMNWDWKFATGFVFLILIHELGHLVAAQRFGLRTGPPVFIPMMGAFISLKDRAPNAWVEAIIGIGGPLFGTFAAGVCFILRSDASDPFWGQLAFYGFLLNLFNLAPVGFLDGGRIVTAISPWLWIPGYLLMLLYTLFSWQSSDRFPSIPFFVLLMGIPRLFSLFKHRSPADQRYYDLEPSQRLSMSLAYFGLIVVLLLGLLASKTP